MISNVFTEQRSSKFMEVHDYLQGEPGVIILGAKTNDQNQ